MRFSLYIAKRYLFSKSDNNAINIISIIAALGVIAATFALFVVLSVFSGLKDFSLSFTNAYDPDLKVLPAEGKKITLNDQQFYEILEISDVKKASQVIEEKVLLQFKDKSSPAIFKAVDSNFLKTNQLNKQLVYGEWYGEGLYQVVMGSRLQRDLSVGIRDYSGLLNIYVPKPGKGQILDISNAFEKASTSVVGVFSVNEELDQNYVIGDINIARELLTFKDHHISAIELKLDEKAD
ncbi:MAG: ABC transporter permease, partial [Psychroflexus sp.]